MLTLREHIKHMILWLRSKTLAGQTSWEEVPEQSEHLWKVNICYKQSRCATEHLAHRQECI